MLTPISPGILSPLVLIIHSRSHNACYIPGLRIVFILQVWCNAPSRNYFCANEIAESKKGIFLFPLVEMLLSPKGTKPLEELRPT